ncbi:MAG TPA: hypothetical protein VIG99_25270 [Myxococcaceae bacterium]|jgi:hypothetical protein
MALIALALSFALPASAQPVDEMSASLWQTVPVFDGFGFRETLAVSADKHLAPWARTRALFRLSSAADIRGSALRQPDVPVMGSFYEFAPSFSVLFGSDSGPFRIQGGVGLSYNVRLTVTEDSVVGFPIVPTGTTSFGTIKQLGLTWDPGVDAVVEAGFAVPLGFRVVVGFGGSLANARLIVRPREDPNLEVAVPELFLTWTFQLGVRWNLKPPPPPPPAPLP